MTRVLCVDFGSTWTKAALVDTDDGTLVATGATATTIESDVLDGYRALRAKLRGERVHEVLACSSAGGGLRLAVVGYEQAVTAEAGRRVGLSAGAQVVHVAAGELTPADVELLRASRPDIVLLVGGTDGGNAEVLRHNARRLGIARMPVPVVLAGNADAADDAVHELASRGRRVVVTDNLLPRIGGLDPGPARAAIRDVFLQHVVDGKGLSRGPQLRRMVQGATPDIVLAGVETLADGASGTPGAGDVLVVDVGGATTDVYSVLSPAAGEDATLRREVVAPLWRARTVEGDLGVRWTAPGVVAAGRAERLLGHAVAGEPVQGRAGGGDRSADAGEEASVEALARYADLVAARPGHLPDVPDHDVRLARLAVTVAARRHGRATDAAAEPRPLRDVRLVVGSGGVLRHHDDAARRQVLQPLVSDHAGGWRVPERARLAVDDRYVLFAAGLLRPHAPVAAARLVGSALREVPR